MIVHIISIVRDNIPVLGTCESPTDSACFPALSLIVANTVVPFRTAADRTVSTTVTILALTVPSFLHACSMAITLQLAILGDWADSVLARVPIVAMVTNAAAL